MLHTMDGPLADQIADMAAELGGAESIHVVSPFFSGHQGEKLLSESLLCERVSVAVPAIAPSVFDFARAAAEGMQVTPRRVRCLRRWKIPSFQGVRTSSAPGSSRW